MKWIKKIWFPLAVITFVTASAMDRNRLPARTDGSSFSELPDTVVYPPYNYRPKNQQVKEFVIDTSFVEEVETMEEIAEVLSARDSIKALLDSSLWDLVEEFFLSDSLTNLAAEDAISYGNMTPEERKRYDRDREERIKMAINDSIRAEKQKKKDIRDSIQAERPRILETYALNDTMQYKRIITWTVDDDFGKMDVSIPDTSANYHFYDYPFQRNDVNATWLGMAGSPVQYYNYSKRKSDEGVNFYEVQESWSYSPRTLPHYNSKTPYTELAYFGTLFGSKDKTSDNLHLFTTQNITPELNFSILLEKFGGAGILEREKTSNTNTVFQSNYLGKRYTMHAGYIGNTVTRQENGGINDISWIRDTTVDSRDIAINLKKADSKIKKNTFFVQQQLRIPFSFIENWKAKKDSLATNQESAPDSINRDITTAFIGHSSELSFYTRSYSDDISDELGKNFYNNVFHYDPRRSFDSLRVAKLDNKVYLRLQPWASEAVISKLDVGIGDIMLDYFDSTATNYHHVENSVYAYAGAEGQIRNNFFWNAKAHYTILGSNFSDFDISADGRINFYPFRRARKSPVSLGVHFETSLTEPTWYNKHTHANHFKWDYEDLSKISRSELSGTVTVPYWDLDAQLAYTLLANNIYYDNSGILRQNEKAMSVLSAYLRKNIRLGPLHLDNKLLFQLSSNEEVLPLPRLSLNLKYYLEFVAARSPRTSETVLTMQIGANAFYNTAWNAPSWNPNLGVFHNQTERSYTNGPYFDIFVNMQWKRACIFVKYQNAGGGWPMRQYDYFSADRYIVTQSGMNGLKFGIFWPFYTEPTGR